MAKTSMVVEIDLMETVQDLVSKDAYLRENYTTGSKVFDFVPGDYVKCTLLKGYHRVCDINGDKVIVSKLSENSNLENIDPNFLKKVELDNRWVKVLYEHRGRRLHNRK